MSIPPELNAQLRLRYPVLDEMPRAILDRALSVHNLPDGHLLFEQGTPCQGFPMLLSGEVRVVRGTIGGREIELYRVTPGEICIASTSSLYGQSLFVANGLVTKPTKLVIASPDLFASWSKEEPFRRYILGVFGDRLADLMTLVEAVAFQRLDQRLAAVLLGHGATVCRTHQSFADELGTVREIVTRLLIRFERDGWIRLGRERVEILNAPALRALAGGGAR
jgi:CRP/FNR family transcriptional regulator, anaerobic regulatory protein